ERIDAFVRGLEPDLHGPQPELVERPLGHLRTGPVRSEERHRKVLVELRSIVEERRPDPIEHLERPSSLLLSVADTDRTIVRPWALSRTRSACVREDRTKARDVTGRPFVRAAQRITR